MNTLVGEISSLVWQNEPLPPPPPSDFLTPSTIPDFEKTPTNELASPSPYHSNLETDGNSFSYPINTLNSECYENCQLPELPPRQPALPPRGENLSSRDSSTSRETTSSHDNAREVAPGPSRPALPQRIPLSSRDKLVPFVPPRDKMMTSRESDPPSRNVTLPPRTIPLRHRDSITRTNNTTATPSNSRGHSQTLPPRIQPRAPGINPPQRIPVPRHPVSDNGVGPPHLPPRIKADSSQNARHDPSLVSPHMPARVPLPAGRQNPGPVYTEVEKSAQRGNFPRVIHQREFSPYVVPSAPCIDRWEEYTGGCVEKKSQTLKKKVKVKIPQR